MRAAGRALDHSASRGGSQAPYTRYRHSACECEGRCITAGSGLRVTGHPSPSRPPAPQPGPRPTAHLLPRTSPDRLRRCSTRPDSPDRLRSRGRFGAAASRARPSAADRRVKSREPAASAAPSPTCVVVVVVVVGGGVRGGVAVSVCWGGMIGSRSARGLGRNSPDSGGVAFGAPSPAQIAHNASQTNSFRHGANSGANSAQEAGVRQRCLPTIKSHDKVLKVALVTLSASDLGATSRWCS